VNVSSATGSPRFSRTKGRRPKTVVAVAYLWPWLGSLAALRYDVEASPEKCLLGPTLTSLL